MTDTRTDATALEALALRVEGGEVGREIDAEVWRAFGYRVKLLFRGTAAPSIRGAFLAYPPDGPGKCEPGKLAVSTSLDAVAALAERVLGDGWVCRVTQLSGIWESSLNTIDGKFLIKGDVEVYGHAPTECAARLAAILRAKAKDQTND